VTKMMKQFDHMIERKLNLELSNVFPRLKFLAGCGQFSDFSNISTDATQILYQHYARWFNSTLEMYSY
jgi:hypothetical protein